MGATIRISCPNGSSDLVAGFDNLVSNRRVARETLLVAMRCVDKLAEVGGLSVEGLCDSIILTNFTSERRGFSLALGINGKDIILKFTRQKGNNFWTIRNSTPLEGAVKMEPVSEDPVKFTTTIQVAYVFGERVRVSQLPDRLIDFCYSVAAALESLKVKAA